MLEVDDAAGHAAGRYRVATDGGRAAVTRTDQPADGHWTAETLGSLYLGGVDVAALARAGGCTVGRGAGPPFAEMADLAVPPYYLTGF